VAVSIASAWPDGQHVSGALRYKSQISLLLILLITYVNLRGQKSRASFAAPTYYFLAMLFLLIGTGFWQAFPALGTNQ
jgi:hypothetical protein